MRSTRAVMRRFAHLVALPDPKISAFPQPNQYFPGLSQLDSVAGLQHTGRDGLLTRPQHGFNGSRNSRPVRAVEGAITDCFRDVSGTDLVAAFEVGDRPANFKNPVISARR